MIKIDEKEYAIMQILNNLANGELLSCYDFQTERNTINVNIKEISRYISMFVEETESPIEALMCVSLFEAITNYFYMNEHDWLYGLLDKPKHITKWVFETIDGPLSMHLKHTEPTDVVTIRQQVEIGDYRVDFLIEHPKFKLIIECDGYQWHEKTQTQFIKEKQRDRFFASNGYTVLHYAGKENRDNIWEASEEIADVIYKKINEE